MIDPEAALLMAESRFALAREYRAPRAGRDRATLAVVRGATHVTVDGSAQADELFHAKFTDLVAAIAVEDDTVRVDYRHHGGRGRKRPADGTVALNPYIEWRIVVHGGLARVRLLLSDVPLESLAIDGGLSDVEVVLPRPGRPVPITVIGGLHHVRIVRPADVAMRLALRGGAARLAFDRQTFDAVGGMLECASPGYEDAQPGYDVRVTGGASQLTLGTAGK